MKPLTADEFEVLSDLGNENKFQKIRMQEMLMFWDSGAEAAEIKTSGDVTLARECELYKKALRQLKLHLEGIKFYQRRGKLYARKNVKHRRRWECPMCGGRLSEIRANGDQSLRHCYSCHFEFQVDTLGNAYREGEQT